MILGVGTDIIEIIRVDKAVKESKGFLERIFTSKEINYFKERKMNKEVIAGNFAAKEAVSKSLGTGFRNFNFTDIEILRDSKGKPIVILHNKAKEIAEDLVNGTKQEIKYIVHLSISHNNDSAIAFAILERC